MSEQGSPIRKPTRQGRLIAHAIAFLGFISLWTWKLLEPYPVPEELREGLASAGLDFAAAKTLHAIGYAFLTVLAGTLPIARLWRHWLIGLLVLHGVATEIGQTFVPNRTGRAADVFIDWGGVLMGTLVVGCWNWRNASKATKLPEGDSQTRQD